jgi:hypothetical protein
MSSEFWLSDYGIELRLEDLAEAVTWETFNNATRLAGSEAGAKEFEWVTEIGPTTCNYCDSQSGRRYRIGQFIPQIPAHNNCLHPNALVHTIRGLIPIRKVAVGDLVWTHKGRYRSVMQLHRRRVKEPLFRVDGCGMTGNHPVLTPDGWVRIDGLQNGAKAYFVEVSRNCDVVLRNLDSNKFKSLSERKFRTARIIKVNDLSHGQSESGKGSISLASPHPLTLSSIDIYTTQYKGYVHNLSVLEDESYAIGERGLVVHNCRCHWDVLFK